MVSGSDEELEDEEKYKVANPEALDVLLHGQPTPATPRPMMAPPLNAALAGPNPALTQDIELMDGAPRTPEVLPPMVIPPLPWETEVDTDARGEKRLPADSFDDDDTREHKRLALPADDNPTGDGERSSSSFTPPQNNNVARMVVLDGEVLPDGDDLGDGMEYYLSDDEGFDPYDAHDFFGENPPELSPEELRALEEEEERNETENLMSIGVITPVDENSTVGHPFMTTRYVHDWRWRDGKWKRRARFVSREFKWLEPWREEFFSPASSAACTKLLSAICLQRGWCMWAIDVKNAYSSHNLLLFLWSRLSIGPQKIQERSGDWIVCCLDREWQL